MRYGARPTGFQLDGWDLRPWTEGALNLDGFEPCLILAVRPGIRIIALYRPPGSDGRSPR
jgi:hypothetical protein